MQATAAGPGSVPPPPGVSVPKAVLERYVGEYQFMPRLTIVVRLKDETTLVGQVAGGPEMPLIATSETRFKAGQGNGALEVEFVVDQAGGVTQIVRSGPHEMRAVRKR